MGKEPKLTKLQEDLIVRAYNRADHTVVGGAPRVKEALVALKYITRIGVKNGYDVHVLTEPGTARAYSVMTRRHVKTESSHRPSIKTLKVKAAVMVKAEVLDDMSDILNQRETETKVFYLGHGWKIRFDRTGSNSLSIQVTKP